MFRLKYRQASLALLTFAILNLPDIGLGETNRSPLACYDILTKSAGRNRLDHSSPRHYPATPVVVTLGPKTAFIENSAILPHAPSVLRLNLSHVGTDQQRWSDLSGILRAVRPFPSALLADNPGPKIRVINSAYIGLHEGMVLGIHRDGNAATVSDSHDFKNLKMPIRDFGWMTEELRTGDPVVIGDDIQGIVTEVVRDQHFNVRILSLPRQGYILSGNKGIQAPGVNVNAPSLTDLDFQNTDWIVWTGAFQGITISFIRDGADVKTLSRHMAELRDVVFPAIKSSPTLNDLRQKTNVDLDRIERFLDSVSFRAGMTELSDTDRYVQIRDRILEHHGRLPMIWAKIETVTAMRNLPSIVSELALATGGIIVARGDLSIQTGRDLPAAQFLIAHAAKKSGIPVIVATGGFSTPAEKRALTPADTLDAGTSAMLQAGLMVSEQTAMAIDPERLSEVIKHMNYVARQAYDYGRDFRLQLGIDNFFALDEIGSQDHLLHEQASRLINQTRSQGTNGSLGQIPLVFTYVPDPKLIQTIRLMNWNLPILIIQSGQSSTESEFLAKRMRFYPFVTVVESIEGHSPMEIVRKFTWGDEGDWIVLVNETGTSALRLGK